MNKFFTILFIPEKTSQVKKLIIPAAYLRIAIVLGLIGSFFLAFMIYDYINVMQQISQNRKLQVENRELRQRIQTFHSKLRGIEDALERIQTFTTKLRIITNQAGDQKELLEKRIAPDLPGVPMDDHSETSEQTPRSPSSNNTQSSIKQQQSPPILPPVDPKILENYNELEALKQSRPHALEEDEPEIDDNMEEEFTKLESTFEYMSKKDQLIEMDVQTLASALLDQRDYLVSIPTLKPTDGWYTSGFGMRVSPYTGRTMMHEGLDIANHFGRTIFAPAAGIVTYAGAKPGYGKLLTIDHGYGMKTQYGHISSFYVRAGDRVNRGQKIAAVGNSGRSTGPHLHYEVRVNDIPFNPYFFVLHD